MYLLITQDGSVRYKRLKAGGSTSVVDGVELTRSAP